MGQPEAKAAGFNTSLTVARALAGDERWRRFVAALPPDDAALVEHPPLAMSWLPLERVIRIHNAIFRDLFDGDPAKAFELGRRQFQSDLSTLYRMFIRVASPKYVIERAARIYETYVRNAGTMRVTDERATSVALVVEGHPSREPLFYEYLRGSIVATLEMTRVKAPSVRILEVGFDSGRWVYQLTWS